MMAHSLELRDIKSHGLERTVREQGALIIIHYL